MAKDQQVLNGESSNASKGKQILTGESSNASKGKQILEGESSNASQGKQILMGESSNASKGKQILEGESSNASEGKQMLKGESSNATKGKQLLKQVLNGESSNASKGKQLLNAFKSLGLLPLKQSKYSATKNKLTEVYGNLFKNGYISKDNVILPDAGSTVQTTNHSTMYIELGDTVGTRSHSRTREARHKSSKFRVCLRCCYYITCFGLEAILSFALKLFSSQKNRTYTLGGLVAVSGIALILFIAELVWKGKREKVTWKRRGKICWFYDPTNKLFGTFPDIFGLIFGVLEFIISTISLTLYLTVKKNPIEIPVCSLVLATLILCFNLCPKCPIDQDDDEETV